MLGDVFVYMCLSVCVNSVHVCVWMLVCKQVCLSMCASKCIITQELVCACIFVLACGHAHVCARTHLPV